MMAGLLGVGSQAGAAVLGFSENFDSAAQGTTLPSPFVEVVGAAGTGADYSIVAGPTSGNVLQGLVSGSATSTSTGQGANISAAVPITDAPGNGFVVSTNFRLDSFSAGGSASTLNFALAALGTSTNFSTGSNYRLFYTQFGGGNTGKLTIGEIGATGTAVSGASTGTLTPVAGLEVTLTFTGTYSGVTLTLSGTLNSGATTLTVGAVDATPLTGTNFGYRTALNAQLGTAQTGPIPSTLDVRYDNFSVSAVPEPASIAGLAIGAMAMLGRRRRA